MSYTETVRGFWTSAPSIISHLNTLQWRQPAVPKSSGKRTFCGCFGMFPVHTFQGFPGPLPLGQHSWATRDTLAPHCQVRAAPPLSRHQSSPPPPTPRSSSSHCPQALPPWPGQPVMGETPAVSSSGLLLSQSSSLSVPCLCC